MIVDKITKQYEQNPLYPSVDWYGELDGEGNFITRENTHVVDETTENGMRLANIIINNYPLISLVEDEGQLVHVIIEPFLEEIKTKKISGIKQICNTEILAGFESSAKGSPVWYGFEYEDQINIEALKNNVMQGLIAEGTLEYYAKSQPCEAWTNAEFLALYNDAMTFKTLRIRKAKGLITLIENAATKEEVWAVIW